MNTVDWIVLFGTLGTIVLYGVMKTRGAGNMEAYLLGSKSLPWWTVCLSIMATQASAITFLSTTGQGYEDGMRFLQFYFGLPLAMIILSVTAVPLYHKLKVFTAYEYLETRFDLKTRSLAAFYFLMLRGVSVGITIYAPSLILSTILGWNINWTTVLIGSLVMIYVVSGGTKAVSVTQKYQLTIIMTGMVLTGLIAFWKLPGSVSFTDAFRFAGETGKLNLINLSFNLEDRYNIWSGLIGGLFLFLSYFGADQSQVGRYLSGSSITESRLGLIFNGILKIPMQFIILYIGLMIFVFYQFYQPPLIHNVSLREKVVMAGAEAKVKELEAQYDGIFLERRTAAEGLMQAIQGKDAAAIQTQKESLKQAQQKENELRNDMKELVQKELPGQNPMDKDYVFIHFVMSYLPHGLIGLLLAVVFSAAMSSMASELNALASTTTVDIYRRSMRPGLSDAHYVTASRWMTIGWCVFAIVFASLANQAENLIQFVNIVGSLWYGTILGIFLSAFYLKYLRSNAVFWGAIFAELIILYLYFFTKVAFLLYNIIGCVAVIVLATVFQFIGDKKKRPAV
ncbi:MAG: sodium:solute symporter [Bacteroidetes bacterium]|nr:sodium:solute symporter [Bacteroidota bacterium]